MKCEFERRFLVKDDRWMRSVSGVRHLRDGLVAATEMRKVRVRIEGARAWLTVKGPRSGIGRLEFEYEIPLAHAEMLIAQVCGDDVVEKTRYLVPHSGVLWEVDVYGGVLQGVTYAEVELASEDQVFALPDWIGEEVTGDSRHSKRALVAASRGRKDGGVGSCQAPAAWPAVVPVASGGAHCG